MKNKSVEIRILKSLLRGERNDDGQGGHGCHLGGIRPGLAGQAMDREGGKLFEFQKTIIKEIPEGFQH